MPFNARQFRDNLRYAGARLNSFEIIITKADSFFNKASGGTTMLMCNAASTPGVMVGTIPIPYFGRSINVSGDRMFEDWNCMLYCDEDMVTRNAFEKWNSMLAYTDYDTNQEHGEVARNINSYVTDIIIKQYTKTGSAMKYYKLVNAFPYMVSPVQLSWQANDQILTFDVQWKYDYFVTSLQPFPQESAYADGASVNTQDIKTA